MPGPYCNEETRLDARTPGLFVASGCPQTRAPQARVSVPSAAGGQTSGWKTWPIGGDRKVNPSAAARCRRGGDAAGRCMPLPSRSASCWARGWLPLRAVVFTQHVLGDDQCSSGPSGGCQPTFNRSRMIGLPQAHLCRTGGSRVNRRRELLWAQHVRLARFQTMITPESAGRPRTSREKFFLALRGGFDLRLAFLLKSGCFLLGLRFGSLFKLLEVRHGASSSCCLHARPSPRRSRDMAGEHG